MKVFAPLQWITWIAYLACTPGFAQTPSAGSIQQNIDNTVHQLPGPSKEVSKLIPAPDVHPIGGISFKLSKIDYSGNTFLTNDQIVDVLLHHRNWPQPIPCSYEDQSYQSFL